MTKLAIIADSSQDLTFELAHQFGLELLSYQIQMGDQHFKDLVDIDTTQFYRTMQDYKVLSTGIPPINEALDLLDKLKAQGYDQALMLCSSAKVTGMRQIYKVLQDQYEGMELFVFDTEQIASSAGLQSILASQMNQAGASVQEILAELERVRPQTDIYALFRTLEYLVRGGRFNKYKGMLGQILKIQPLLKMIDGEVGVIGKVRGKKKSFQAFVDQIKADLKGAQRYRLAIFSGDNQEEVLLLKEALANEIEKAELVLETQLTAVLGVHAGPNSIGIATQILD